MSLDDVLKLIAAALPVLVPVAMVLYKLALAQLPAAKAAQAEKTVSLLVTAVEQVFAAVPGSGADKKAEVLRLAQELHVPASPAALNVLIEAAVAMLPPLPHAAPAVPVAEVPAPSAPGLIPEPPAGPAEPESPAAADSPVFPAGK